MARGNPTTTKETTAAAAPATEAASTLAPPETVEAPEVNAGSEPAKASDTPVEVAPQTAPAEAAPVVNNIYAQLPFDPNDIEAVTKHLASLQASTVSTTIIGAGPKLGDVVFIANHHTAPIMLPRHGAVGMNVQPIVLTPGMSTPVNANEWMERLKDNKTLQYYLDHNILSEVKREGQVAVSEATTGNATPPPNLQTDAEKTAETGSGTAQIKATVTKTDVKMADVKENGL